VHAASFLIVADMLDELANLPNQLNQMENDQLVRALARIFRLEGQRVRKIVR